MNVLLLALGAGMLWHGLQIVWVAPSPSQFRRRRISKTAGGEAGGHDANDVDTPEEDNSIENKQALEASIARKFQIFWLDQYAWIGIVLSVLGIVIVMAALL